ncbi:MAG: type II toxin-antitoxin system Phd/YefM family antitoxin [Natronosporangium sp.]
MSTVPLADARARLSEIVTDAQTSHERYEITRNGRPAAVLLASDDYESMQETIAVLADSELMESIKAGIQRLKAGDHLDENELDEYVRRSGRHQ